MTDVALAQVRQELQRFVIALRAECAQGTDALDREAAEQTVRLAAPLARQLDAWIAGRACRAALASS